MRNFVQNFAQKEDTSIRISSKGDGSSNRIIAPLAIKNNLSVSLLKKGEADARSVQKTPAGVLAVRRGLFFVKRQRRCPSIFKRRSGVLILSKL